MKPVFHNITKARAILFSTALISFLGNSGAAQQVLDTAITIPLSFPLGGSLLVTGSGDLSVTGIGVNAITTGSVYSSFINHGSISSQLGYAFELGGHIALENAGYIGGDLAGIHCAPGPCTLNGFSGVALNSVGGVIQGDSHGIQLENGSMQNVVNAGIIRGLLGDGIQVSFDGISGGNISNFENLSTGIISGGLGGTFAIRADSMFNFTNAGQIGQGGNGSIWIRNQNPLLPGEALSNFSNEASGTIAGEIYGVVVNGDADTINNAGQILVGSSVNAASTAFDVDGSLTNFFNSGLIENSGNHLSTTRGVTAATIDGMVNSGSIIATNLAAGYATYAIRSEGVGSLGITSLVNSGMIFADFDPVSLVNGYAIFESNVSGWGGDTELTLLAGSLLQGRVFLGSVGTDTIIVETGLNLAITTEDYGAVDIVDAGLGLHVVQTAGAQSLIAVADTSVLAAGDNVLSAATGAVSNIVADQLSTLDQGGGEQVDDESYMNNWWVKGYGGIGRLSAEAGLTAATNYAYGGLVAGADFNINGQLQLGVVAGALTGQVSAAVVNGQELQNNGVFLGGYGRYDADNFNLNFGLTAGYTETSSQRFVANNLVVGGLETATANYGSFYFSPEVKLGSDNWQFGQLGLNPTVRLRYTYMHADDYTETGLTDGNLTVGPRDTHVLDLRAQLAFPVLQHGPNTDIEIRAGIDGHFTIGGNFDATLLGVTTAGFDAGGANSAISGFLGIDVEHRLNEKSHLFLSAELGAGMETAFSANIEAGFKITF